MVLPQLQSQWCCELFRARLVNSPPHFLVPDTSGSADTVPSKGAIYLVITTGRFCRRR